MAKMLKFALLGGAVGAGVWFARSNREPAAPAAEDTGSSALKVAGGAALAGAAVGFVLDRRSSRKRKTTVRGALKAGSLAEAARAAKPAIEHAIETARPRVEHAIETARPRVEHAIETARPRVEHAIETARPRVEQAAEAARARLAA